MSVRVLLVDDFQLVREGLRMALETVDGVEIVGEAGDGAQGVAEAERLRPDVVLMDVRMPELDGIEATRRIAALDGPPIRVLLLSTFDLEEYLYEGVRAGVGGITLKDTPPDELAAGIEALARGDALVDPETTVRLIASVTRSFPAGRAARTGSRRWTRRSASCSPRSRAAARTPRSARARTRSRRCSRSSACASGSGP